MHSQVGASILHTTAFGTRNLMTTSLRSTRPCTTQIRRTGEVSLSRTRRRNLRNRFSAHKVVVPRVSTLIHGFRLFSPVAHEEIAHDSRQRVVYHHLHLAKPLDEQGRHQVVELKRQIHLFSGKREEQGQKQKRVSSEKRTRRPPTEGRRRRDFVTKVGPGEGLCYALPA